MKKILRKIKSTIKNILIVDNEYYKSRFGYSYKFWQSFPFNLDVINLGSNTGLFGFKYDNLPLKCANWAMSPQSLNQDLAILKTYSSFVGPRGTILVPLCPYSSCLKSYTDTELEKYYTILHPGVIDNFSLDKQKNIYNFKLHPYKAAPKQMIKGLMGTMKKKLMMRKSPLEYDTCPLSEVQMEKNAEQFIAGWKKQFRIVDMDSERPAHINEGRKQRIATLREINNFCEDRGFMMYIVLPPISKALSEKMSSTFRDNYIYSFLKEAGIRNSQFMNYIDDPLLQKNEYFYNSLFLNKTGGEAFTRRVLEDIGLLQ